MIEVAVAVLVAIPATITAMAAWKRASRRDPRLATSNGSTIGEMVESTHHSIEHLSRTVDHINQRAERMEAKIDHHLADHLSGMA